MPVKGNTRISFKESTFYKVEISTSLVGLEPTIPRLHTEFHYSSCLWSSKQGISNIFLYIGVSKQRNCIRKWQKKYELNMSDDGHFEFYDLWENGVIYSLAYGRNGFNTKFHIETTNEVLFLKNAYRSLSRAIFQFLSRLIHVACIYMLMYLYIHVLLKMRIKPI